MNTFMKKFSLFFNVTTLMGLFFFNSLSAHTHEVAKAKIDHYFKEFPWIGLIADKIKYGPITVTDINIESKSKLAVVEAGTTLHGSLRYRIDPKNLDALHRYHLVVGIEGVGPQDCITHTYGIWQSTGQGRFTLKAPLEPGVYQVRFMLSEGLTCEKGREVWDSGLDAPSSAATIGIIIVI